MPNSSIENQIIILDDDAWPNGRITQRLLPEFKIRCLDQYVHHYETFTSLIQDIRTNKVSTNNLFVLDSSLDKEPNGKLLSFKETVPSLNNHGVLIKRMMPGSGWIEGMKNNQWFEDYAERRGRVPKINQMALFSSGLSGEPKSVVNGILAYHKELYPGIIQKETEGNPCSPEALTYWNYRNSHEK